MKATIAVLPGDGIGPEVTAEAVRCLERIAAQDGHQFELPSAPVGAAAMLAGHDPLPTATLALAQSADAVLFGAIGDPRFSDPSLKVRPELSILGLRAGLGLFANLRPVATHPRLHDASPLKNALLEGVDMMVVRELTGGLYFGRKTLTADVATDECAYSVGEVTRVARVAGRLAQGRRRKVTSVDKANVLETSRLWRRVTEQVFRAEFADCALEHMYVDAAAMHLLKRPRDFDVLLTENLFGDILTDEAAMLAGSLGLLPSASVGEGTRGLYEPIHGSAPDIAGRGIANPYATILSAAMLLDLSLGLADAARRLERAVSNAIDRGVWTADLGGQASTRDAGNAVLDAL